MSALGAGLAVFVSVALGTCSCLKGLWTLPGRASSAAASARVTAALEVFAACAAGTGSGASASPEELPEVERDGERGDQQEHGHGPQLALDEVAQQSADGVHRVTSVVGGRGRGRGAGGGVAPAVLGVVVDGVVDVVALVGREQVGGRGDVGLHAGEPGRARREREGVDAQQAPADVDALAVEAHEGVDLVEELLHVEKLPVKRKVNGMVGKPAEPTVAPGGRVAAAAWVAGAGVVSRAWSSSSSMPHRCPRRRRWPPLGWWRRCWWARGPGRRRPRPSASGSRCGRCATRPAADRAARAAHRSWARPCRAARCPRSPCRSASWPSHPATPSAARRSAAC